MKILIFDWHNFIKKYSYVGNLYDINKDEIIGAVIPRLINNISRILQNISPDIVFVCSDSGINKRAKAIYADYKANRGKAKTLTDEEREIDNLNYLCEFIQSYPFGFLSIKDTEADMLIKCTIDYLQNIDENVEFIIASMDSDFYQLISNNISVYNWKEIITLDNWNDKIKSDNNIMPYDYALCKSIVGDSSDNIKGVQGWGWVKTTKLFNIVEQKFPNKPFTNLDIFIKHIVELNKYETDKENSKLFTKFLVDMSKAENIRIVKRNQQLIDLSMLETPYIFNIINEIKQIINKPFVFNKKKFISLLNLKGYKTDYEIDDIDYQAIVKKNVKSCFELTNFAKKAQRAQICFRQ